ncbi:gluconate 2-dehydrogenase subunit 3 family protein [Halorientalis brevis]|uniref:Gluconate 2-dehydrogenase subunit 3 family protein n=1 Tax=Halorientalis brevis TaxID=1126241 RepID=A0ABD6CF77_9EURY|nr:gluconate 2-dehydrogenase subunit 3 family protein [Halorientalis brevis]
MTNEETDATLTRRDAIRALAAAGVTAGGGALLVSADDDREANDDAATTVPGSETDAAENALGEHELSTMVAIADVVYPTAVDNVAAFVEQYLRGRVADDPDRAAELTDAVEYLDGYAETWYDASTFRSLSPEIRAETLDRMGADTVSPDPDGGNVQRVRYYCINDLLFALYASPTGGKLVGIENPQGHPGGATSYRAGPRS